MEISIRSHHAEVTDGLRTVVEERLRKCGRFFDGIERAEVRFTGEKAHRLCEITLQGRGHVVRAQAGAADALVAFERGIDKTEHQLLKLKSRLVGRSHVSAGHHNAGV